MATRGVVGTRCDGDERGRCTPCVAEPPTRGDSLEAYLEDPLSPLDTRCVMWELGKRGVSGDGTDELVVPYSTAFSAVMACNQGGAAPQPKF